MKTHNQDRIIRMAILCVWLLAAAPTQAFYNPTMGRWINRDPIKERGGPNLYATVANCPLMAVDALGEFLTFGHNEMLENAFGKWAAPGYSLSGADLIMLKAGSKFVDDGLFQDPEHSYMHAMVAKARPGESQELLKQEAMRKAQDFVLDRLFGAADEGDRDLGLFNLGMGMHTIMDSLSPEHAGFQVWGGMNGWSNLASAAGHVVKEFFHSIPAYVDNISGSNDALRGYYEMYELLSP